MSFIDRSDAGKQLAQLLANYAESGCIVCALPRGGVPVAREIAERLSAPLDLIFAHKIGHPQQPEYAIAATSERGHLLRNRRELQGIDQKWLESAQKSERAEIARKRKKYLKNRKELCAEGKIAILVDDGIATGLTMEVAILELKDRNPAEIIVAIPVVPKSTADHIGESVDQLVAVLIPDDQQFLGAVGAYYQNFNQVEDEEVIQIVGEQ